MRVVDLRENCRGRWGQNVRSLGHGIWALFKHRKYVRQLEVLRGPLTSTYVPLHGQLGSMSWKFMDRDDNNITKPTDTEWPFKIMNFEIKINYYKKELGVINLCFKLVHSHFPRRSNLNRQYGKSMTKKTTRLRKDAKFKIFIFKKNNFHC